MEFEEGSTAEQHQSLLTSMSFLTGYVFFFFESVKGVYLPARLI